MILQKELIHIFFIINIEAIITESRLPIGTMFYHGSILYF